MGNGREKQYKNHVMVIILGLVLLLVTTGCAKLVDLGPLATTNCKPPCWYGLYPEMMITREELLARLEKIPGVDGIGTYDELPGMITFSWKPNQEIKSRKLRNYYNIMDHFDQKISLIRLTIPYTLTLDLVIENLGQPQFLGYFVWPVFRTVNLFAVYPEQGITFELEEKPLDELTISSSDIIDSAVYRKEIMVLLIDRLLPWPGYGSIAIPQ